MLRYPLTQCLLSTALLCGLAVPAQAASFSFTFSDHSGEFEKRGWLKTDSLFQRNFRAAGARWGALIDSNQTIRVNVMTDQTTPRFSAGITVGRSRPLGLQTVFEPGALSRILSGSNPGGEFDVTITINVAFMDQWYWIDTQPETRSQPVGLNKTDLVSIVMHELGHGLGIAARRVGNTAPAGGYPDNARSVYDRKTWFQSGSELSEAPVTGAQLVFLGEESMMVNGNEPVKLTNLPQSDPGSSQNYSHIGDCTDGTNYRETLMNGCSVPTDGSRLKVTPLDAAMVADMGFPMRSIYFADRRMLLTAVPLQSGSKQMTAAWLKLVDAQKLLFELVAATGTDRLSADAVPVSGSADWVLERVALNDSLEHVKVVLSPVPNTSPLQLKVTSLTPVTVDEGVQH
ncbi:hypothetical protein [Parachitinimonas caeni]|uniref:Peptidase M10 metallopeptidase domain-containing protein n=1 Tax=Parachitinimonas caeni TaxID=3031301 RepID=A0ABT7DS98_9NEIS|nr:hypothetical protein [Parachitinimonas caeni]MDK2122938.1 hypothetical protein [Parachitinimonas caeni]